MINQGRAFLYDGTFEGFLTVVNMGIKRPSEVVSISIGQDYQPDLFSGVQVVETDTAIARSLFQKFCRELPKVILIHILYCFLSEEAGMEKELLNYLCLIYSQGIKAANNYSNRTVVKIQRTSDKVGHEIHRLHGFVRFRKMKNGLYYAPVEPIYNIIQFLAPHFRGRFADQNWLIHDVKRKTGIYYRDECVRYLPCLEIPAEILSVCGSRVSMERIQNVLGEEEAKYQEIWEQYFKQIAVVERTNPRLQKQRMPERYWRFLVEDVEGRMDSRAL